MSARGRRAVDISGGADHDGSLARPPVGAPAISSNEGGLTPVGRTTVTGTGIGSNTRAISSADLGCWRVPVAETETGLAGAGLRALAIGSVASGEGRWFALAAGAWGFRHNFGPAT